MKEQPWHTEGYLILGRAFQHLLTTSDPTKSVDEIPGLKEATNLIIDCALKIREETTHGTERRN